MRLWQSPSPPKARAVIPLLGTAMIALAACQSPLVPREPPIPDLPSILHPASTSAGEIAGLFWLIFWLMLAIFVGVTVAIVLFYMRYRARSGNERGRPIFGNTRLEIVWTAIPVLILVVVFALTLRVMHGADAPDSEAAEAAGPAIRVTAVGHQFWWEFGLPDLGVVTANELHLPVGQRVEVELTSHDVIHNYWVPRLHGKRDMVPGQVNRIAFVPTEQGIFHGACAEFCGIQHAWMRLRVIVHSPEDFQAWVQLQRQEARLPQDPLVERGRQLYYDVGCQACHVVRGIEPVPAVPGAITTAGPELTHIASRDTLAAGVLENNADNMALWLADPQAVKPGSFMPDMRLDPEAVAAITAYMMSLE